LGPNLGDIKDIPPVGGGLLQGHDLHLDGPGGEVALLNGLKEVAGGIVWVRARKGGGLLSGEVLDLLVGLEVKLDPVTDTLVINELEGVAGEAIHVAVTIWGATIREEDGKLVNGLWNEGGKVPNGIRILEVGTRVPLLGVNEVGELLRIADEEDWGVVASHVPVALLGVELEGEPTRVTVGVSRSLLASDSGEAKEDRGALANGAQELGLGEVAYVLGHLKKAMGSGTLRVNNSLWDTLTVKVGELVNQVEVLQESRGKKSERKKGKKGKKGKRSIKKKDRFIIIIIMIINNDYYKYDLNFIMSLIINLIMMIMN
jgi:hypothetical protein